MADPASGASVVLQAPFHPVQILPDLAPASSFTSCLIIYDLGCQTIFFCISVWLFPLSEMPPFLRPYPNQVGAYSSYKLHLDAFSPENTPWPVHETNRCSTGIYWYSPPPYSSFHTLRIYLPLHFKFLFICLHQLERKQLKLA